MSVPDRPVRMNAEQKRADDDAIRRSHTLASASPPPKAGPFTAATTTAGTSRRWTVRFDMNVCPSIPACRWRCSPGPGGAPWSLRSRPAQNPRPAPVRTATFTSGSAAISSRASWSSATIWKLMAFRRSGRFRVTTRMPVPAASTVTVFALGIGGRYRRPRPPPACDLGRGRRSAGSVTVVFVWRPGP